MHARWWSLAIMALLASAIGFLDWIRSQETRDVVLVSLPAGIETQEATKVLTPITSSPFDTSSTATLHPLATPRPTVLLDHSDAISPECRATVSHDLILHWRSDGRRTVCQDPTAGINITEFSELRLEYKPILRVLENIDVENIFSDTLLPSPCPKDTYFEEESGHQAQLWALGSTAGGEAYTLRGHNISHVSGRTIVHIKRFDPFNPYEAFHSYLNMFLASRVLLLNMSNVQIVLTDVKGHSAKDEEIWESLTDSAYPLLSRHVRMTDAEMTPVRVERLVQSSSSGTSLLSSNKGPLHGRGANHDCKSELFRDASRWIRDSVFRHHASNNVTADALLSRPQSQLRVIWVSRKPYPREGKLFHVKCVVSREADLVRLLQERLGVERFAVTAVNFAALTAYETLRTVTGADIVVGLHGAGLMWSAFLPRHGGIVEIFGGDRGMRNRHFHNMAKLADLHYRSMLLSPRGGGGGGTGLLSTKRRVMELKWSPSDVDKMAELIRSIPIHSSVEP